MVLNAFFFLFEELAWCCFFSLFSAGVFVQEFEGEGGRRECVCRERPISEELILNPINQFGVLLKIIPSRPFG